MTQRMSQCASGTCLVLQSQMAPEAMTARTTDVCSSPMMPSGSMGRGSGSGVISVAECVSAARFACLPFLNFK